MLTRRALLMIRRTPPPCNTLPTKACSAPAIPCQLCRAACQRPPPPSSDRHGASPKPPPHLAGSACGTQPLTCRRWARLHSCASRPSSRPRTALCSCLYLPSSRCSPTTLSAAAIWMACKSKGHACACVFECVDMRVRVCGRMCMCVYLRVHVRANVPVCIYVRVRAYARGP